MAAPEGCLSPAIKGSFGTAPEGPFRTTPASASSLRTAPVSVGLHSSGGNPLINFSLGQAPPLSLSRHGIGGRLGWHSPTAWVQPQGLAALLLQHAAAAHCEHGSAGAQLCLPRVKRGQLAAVLLALQKGVQVSEQHSGGLVFSSKKNIYTCKYNIQLFKLQQLRASCLMYDCRCPLWEHMLY